MLISKLIINTNKKINWKIKNNFNITISIKYKKAKNKYIKII